MAALRGLINFSTAAVQSSQRFKEKSPAGWAPFTGPKLMPDRFSDCRAEIKAYFN
jgi:hypothetical protein